MPTKHSLRMVIRFTVKTIIAVQEIKHANEEITQSKAH